VERGPLDPEGQPLCRSSLAAEFLVAAEEFVGQHPLKDGLPVTHGDERPIVQRQSGCPLTGRSG